MTGFIIRTKENTTIRFAWYSLAAPLTVEAFAAELPFTREFLHARVSGQEIWIDNAPQLNVIQENSSVFSQPGEVVIGPFNPARNKIAGCMGIFYGEGKLLDCGNIFAKVFEEDMPLLVGLGDSIWRNGTQELTFELL
jgi:hypothetical protein